MAAVGFDSVTCCEALFVVSAALVATTLNALCAGTLAGGVYSPVAEIVP
jgi:hypothetical protein